MSKIICDNCGTSYPETAKQCPICGCVRPGDVRSVTNEVKSDGNVSTGYTYVKGGRFTKSNVKKRSAGQAHSASGNKSAPQKNNSDEKDNRGLVITAIVLLLAIIGVVVYIAVRFFGPISDPSGGTTANTGIQSELACTGITLDTDNVLFELAGEARLLQVTVEPKNTTDIVSFRSADEAVATVNQVGKITAVGEGTTTITVTCGNITKECTVTFQLPEESTSIDFTADTSTSGTEETTQQPSEALTLNRKDFTLSYKGDSWMLYDGSIPKNQITWTSDDETVVTIEDGKVVAQRNYPDGVMVHAEYEGQKVSCLVRCTFTEGSGVAGNGGVSEDGGSSATVITGTVTVDGVNVRSGPGTSYADVGDLYANEKVTITETKQGDGRTWGKIGENRWVSMEFVKTN